MSRLRTALSVAGDLASLVTMALFVVGTLAVGGAIRGARLGHVSNNSGIAVQARPRGGGAEPAHGRMPLLSGTEYYANDAKIALVEFGDFECPYCAQFDQVVLPKLKDEFVESSQLAFVYRDFPIARHKHAIEASRAASCAQDQGKYWEMHTLLFARPGQFLPEQLLAHARDLSLKVDEFAACLSTASTSKMEADRALGRAFEVTVTPTFFVGRIVNGTEVEVEWKLLGSQPIEAFREVIARVSRGRAGSRP